EPEEIAASVVARLLEVGEGTVGPWSGRRVLVAAGPTREPLDPVRYLSNRSSGRMGFALAAAAARRGAAVELVSGPVQLATPPGCRRHDVETAEQMNAAVRGLAGDMDLVILAAAVADFRPRAVAEHKIKKGGAVPVVELEPTPDILAGLPEVAPRGIRVGFAAETRDLETGARGKLQRKDAHWIVANDVGRTDIGFDVPDNEVVVFGRDGGRTAFPRQSKESLAEQLLDLFGAA